MSPRLLVVTLMFVSAPAVSDADVASSYLAVAFATAKDGSPARPGQTTSAPHAPQCKLRITPQATSDDTTTGEWKVEIKNIGKTNVTLVTPGDGSNFRWRTPIVGWSLLPFNSKEQHPKEPPREDGGRCGNINSLKPNELFTLKPGDARELGEWTGFPTRLAPGRYRVVFYYSNVPDLKWSGVPLGEHDEDAMRRGKGSLRISLVSNEVQVEVTESGIAMR